MFSQAIHLVMLMEVFDIMKWVFLKTFRRYFWLFLSVLKSLNTVCLYYS